MENLREWQKKAKIAIKNTITKNSNVIEEKLIAVNACVGGGKTNVAFEAFIDYLENQKPEKSIQMFVCPRINLCNQQADDFKKDYKNEIEKYGITVAQWNCASTDFADRNIDTMWSSANVKHYVIFIVDESIWGADITRLYGIELDKGILENVCWKRFDRIIDDMNVKNKKKLKETIRKHIRHGNALNRACYFFSEEDFLKYKVTDIGNNESCHGLNFRNLQLDISSYEFDEKTGIVSFYSKLKNRRINFGLDYKWELVKADLIKTSGIGDLSFFTKTMHT